MFLLLSFSCYSGTSSISRIWKTIQILTPKENAFSLQKFTWVCNSLLVTVHFSEKPFSLTSRFYLHCPRNVISVSTVHGTSFHFKPYEQTQRTFIFRFMTFPISRWLVCSPRQHSCLSKQSISNTIALLLIHWSTGILRIFWCQIVTNGFCHQPNNGKFVKFYVEILLASKTEQL